VEWIRRKRLGELLTVHDAFMFWLWLALLACMEEQPRKEKQIYFYHTGYEHGFILNVF